MRRVSRRKLLAFAASSIGASAMTKIASAETDDAPDRWLRATRLIDKDHHRVRETALSIIAGKNTQVEKALAIFKFVRDEIRFGFTRGFWDNKASDVLASRTGYCNTKSTLFMALLRVADIPVRQVFVDIDRSVLYGIINPGTPYVDHSYVEVLLNGIWVATDAYIVDAPLFSSAQTRALQEDKLLAYGVHATGQMEWDGASPAFAQFNQLDPRPISTRRWGVFEDVADFYDKAEDPWNRLNPLLRASFGRLAASANRRAERIRNGG